MELNEKIYNKIVELCEIGDEFAMNGEMDKAVEKFYEALNLLPKPKNDWEAATWIYTAIGDSYYLDGKYEKAKEAFFEAMNCPDGISNSFILLRQGEIMYELNEKVRAVEFLLRAYMLEGKEIFDGEDNKYLKFLKENVEGI